MSTSTSRGLILLFLLALAVLLGSYAHELAQSSSSQTSPGFKVGRQFKLLIVGFGAEWETYEVTEIRGNWVKAKVVESPARTEGTPHWINTAALPSVYFPDEAPSK